MASNDWFYRRDLSLSEQVIENPISFIENLLRSGNGDEGRLLYLRKAIKNGKTIYESDRKYLVDMQKIHSELKSPKKTSKKKSENISTNHNVSTGIKDDSLKKIQKQPQNKDRKKLNSLEFGLENIQNSLSELKAKESKIKDNLELLVINREILSQTKIDQSNSFGSFSNLHKNTTSDLFELINNAPSMKKASIFGIKKHDALVYASAGLFSLWFVGHQNLIDLGVFQSLSMGFSAGAAVSAGLFYKKHRKRITCNI